MKIVLKDVIIERLPEGLKGRPLLLGKESDQQVQAYLLALRDVGSVVTNTAVVIAWPYHFLTK